MFVVVSKVAAKGIADVKWWHRFPKEERKQSGYMCIGYSSSFCELVLYPRQDIMFHGFGIYAHYHRRQMSLILRWGLDDDKGQEKEITIQDEERDQENNWHVFHLDRVGDEPFKVAAGQKLCIGMRSSDDESRTTRYGRNRGNQYDNIEDNEGWIFDLERSGSTYCTDPTVGQFPFIIYSWATFILQLKKFCVRCAWIWGLKQKWIEKYRRMSKWQIFKDIVKKKSTFWY